MKLPEDTVIAQEKLVRYLLLPREEADKSKFLKAAGYTLAQWPLLERDIRQVLRTHEAKLTQTSAFGTLYEIRASWQSPNGRRLAVITVWIRLAESGQVRFVTLYPDKGVGQ